MKNKHDQLAYEVIEWSEKANPNDIDKWLEYCKRYLRNYGWDNKAIQDFLNWGKYGYNNHRLEFKSSDDSFYAEVEYCSDRMTMDRLFRCHTYYWNLKNKENTNEIKKINQLR